MTPVLSFARTHLVASAGVLSIAALSALLARIAVTGRLDLFFLIWNLLLAWAPFLFSTAMVALVDTKARAMLLPFGAAWLLLLPNAPYLVTDLVHLHERRPVPLWFDIAVFALFAIAGLVLGVGSVWHVERVVARVAGAWAGAAGAVAAIGASGFGIYLGRFLRWNSWDVLFSPRSLAIDALPSLAAPLHQPLAMAVTVCYGGLFAACWLAWTAASAPVIPYRRRTPASAPCSPGTRRRRPRPGSPRRPRPHTARRCSRSRSTRPESEATTRSSSPPTAARG
jgi:uncharacterized membrane protein